MTESYLKTISKDDAYIMRNEIFARHGRPFKTPGLRDFFESKTWYKSIENFSDDALNDVEKGNAAIILGHEKKMGWQ